MTIFKEILSHFAYFSKIHWFLNTKFKILFSMQPARPRFGSHAARESLWVWDPWPKVSISPTFYEQLSCVQIPKGPKIHSSFQSFLHFWDLCEWKLLVKCWLNWLQVICVPDTESWHVTKKLSNTREVVTSHNFRMSGWSVKVAFFQNYFFNLA
jgi:hypothetical protein